MAYVTIDCINPLMNQMSSEVSKLNIHQRNSSIKTPFINKINTRGCNTQLFFYFYFFYISTSNFEAETERSF